MLLYTSPQHIDQFDSGFDELILREGVHTCTLLSPLIKGYTESLHSINRTLPWHASIRHNQWLNWYLELGIGVSRFPAFRLDEAQGIALNKKMKRLISVL